MSKKDIEPTSTEQQAEAQQPESPKATPQEAPKEPQTDTAPTLSDVIREQAVEEDAPVTKGMTMRQILGGDILNTSAVRSQLWMFVLITLFIVVYISNRYNCQKSLIAIDKLNKELQDAKYKALSTNSRLTEQTRESRVLESLAGNKDSVLHIANQPPYIITIPQAESNE